jgi:chromosome partitioning protein
MTTVIAVCQLKGGAGRTTLSTNLAYGLGGSLVDADAPQFSSQVWAYARSQTKPDTPPAVASAETHQDVQRLLADVDGYAVVDAPPRTAEVTRALFLLADLVLVPVTASSVDLWATQDLLAIRDEAESAGYKVDLRLVWNKARPYISSEADLIRLAKKELGATFLRSNLGFRVAYSQALAEGLSVLETGASKARDEVDALVREVKRITG